METGTLDPQIAALLQQMAEQEMPALATLTYNVPVTRAVTRVALGQPRQLERLLHRDGSEVGRPRRLLATSPRARRPLIP